MLNQAQFQTIVKKFLSTAEKNDTQKVAKVEFLPKSVIKALEEEYTNLWVNTSKGFIAKI